MTVCWNGVFEEIIKVKMGSLEWALELVLRPPGPGTVGVGGLSCPSEGLRDGRRADSHSDSSALPQFPHLFWPVGPFPASERPPKGLTFS